MRPLLGSLLATTLARRGGLIAWANLHSSPVDTLRHRPMAIVDSVNTRLEMRLLRHLTCFHDTFGGTLVCGQMILLRICDKR